MKRSLQSEEEKQGMWEISASLSMQVNWINFGEMIDALM